MRYCYLFIIFVLSLNSTQAASYVELNSVDKKSLKEVSLSESLEMALKANPDIAVAIREREATDGIKVQAASDQTPMFPHSFKTLEAIRDKLAIN